MSWEDTADESRERSVCDKQKWVAKSLLQKFDLDLMLHKSLLM